MPEQEELARCKELLSGVLEILLALQAQDVLTPKHSLPILIDSISQALECVDPR